MATNGGYTLLPVSLANQGAKLLPTSLAKGGAQLLNPAIAGTLAGTQYDQAIADARAALVQQQADNAQAMANVGNWYGQVLDSQGRAAAADHSLSQAAQGSERSSNAAILASLGGGANAAAPSVAAAGENNLGTLTALGNIQDQYNADIVPLLKLGQAGASAQQGAANSRALAAALQNVQDLTAQKGATQAQYQYDILGQNNTIRNAQADRLLSILGQNNDVRNSRVSNLTNIIGANNSTLQTKRSQDTADTQNKVAVILATHYDPMTGGLDKAGQTQLAQLLNVKPGAGTSASTAASIVNSRISNAVRAAHDAQVQSEHTRHDRALEQQGAARVAQGQERIDAAGKPKARSATPQEIQNQITEWRHGKAVEVHDGNGSVQTQTTGQLSYRQAYKSLRSVYHLSDMEARTALDTQYGRGEQGRSYLTNEEQAILRKGTVGTGKGAAVKFYQGHAYITTSQANTLKAAGHLPPGELVAGRYFIKPGG